MHRYKVEERNQSRFVKTPKDLFLNKCYRNMLTSDAKLVYSLLLDRMELSRKNDWVNDNNEIYLIFTKEHLANYLSVSNRTTYSAFKNLEECNLIEQERQGLNKPNKIFIGKTNADFTGNCNICRSVPEKCAGQELQYLQGSETDSSETDNSDNNGHQQSAAKPVYYLQNIANDEIVDLAIYYNKRYYPDNGFKQNLYLKPNQWKRVAEKLGYYLYELQLTVDEMQKVIDKYFADVKSDHNILHFVSGDIIKHQLASLRLAHYSEVE